MDKLTGQMVELAQQYHARKVCLFGSRARGDNRPDSDYDFAIWGVAPDCQLLLRSDVEEQIQSLLKLDLVFVTEQTDNNLLTRIEKEGIILLDRFETKYENYKNALLRLKEGIAQYENHADSIVLDGIIQRFEFTCELAWKTAREYLLDQGYADINSPKAVMKQAYADGLITDQEGWIKLLTDRNLTSHLYDEATADQIFVHIRSQYVSLLEALLAKLCEE